MIEESSDGEVLVIITLSLLALILTGIAAFFLQKKFKFLRFFARTASANEGSNVELDDINNSAGASDHHESGENISSTNATYGSSTTNGSEASRRSHLRTPSISSSRSLPSLNSQTSTNLVEETVNIERSAGESRPPRRSSTPFSLSNYRRLSPSLSLPALAVTKEEEEDTPADNTAVAQEQEHQFADLGSPERRAIQTPRQQQMTVRRSNRQRKRPSFY
ncbi:Oidioi.mRNA.OKI2018_I69.YSR.g17197.t1.cds [Oikopleura dioica]|uniref:Oidioi.mRNA.OKI2018_I69.YSR.g17197.t1.cds n=1 Tax=Oikopleura dioica TaxID=34765 RepID=A0ABN7SNK0_OIKDI|nr:Oidioi.mRNA.OKI2018_I69.YSR.g17197.t1.cds [Oikopleura dioica]